MHTDFGGKTRVKRNHMEDPGVGSHNSEMEVK